MKIIKVVAAIIIKEGKVLIAKRNYGDFAGMWEFPGGKIEENESNQAALCREINEEFDVDIEVGDFLMKAEYQYDNFYLDMDCYLCKLKSEDINLSVHDEAKWISINNSNVDWIPADIQIIERIKEYVAS